MHNDMSNRPARTVWCGREWVVPCGGEDGGAIRVDACEVVSSLYGVLPYMSDSSPSANRASVYVPMVGHGVGISESYWVTPEHHSRGGYGGVETAGENGVRRS